MQTTAKHRSPWKRLFWLLLLAGLGGLGFVIARGQKQRQAAQQEQQATCYQADTAPSQKLNGLLGGLLLLSPEQMAKVPVIDGFQAPCGAPNGAMMYNAQPFGSENSKRGGYHCGDDLNGIGQENTDEGEGVFAAARGLVLFSGDAGPGWGKVVVLGHRLPQDDKIYQTLYAHLKETIVRKGEYLARGQRLGSIGTADGLYLAHLHFELAASRSCEAGMPAYGGSSMMNRLNFAEICRLHPAPPIPDIYDEARQLRIREAAQEGDAGLSTPELPKGSIPVHPSQFF